MIRLSLNGIRDGKALALSRTCESGGCTDGE